MNHRRIGAGRLVVRLLAALFAATALCGTASASGEPTCIRIMPPDGSSFAVGQRFDVLAESQCGDSPDGTLRVALDGEDISGEPGHETESLLGRNVVLERPGTHLLEARLGNLVKQVHLTAFAWEGGTPGARKARNVILMIGDGMGAAHRTAARLVAHGVDDGRARSRLAMDSLEVTGLSMTPSLNSVITDSAPGMSALVTGAKGNNNQTGVFPDNTLDPFDNPRVEYLAELLRRQRGKGFHVGLVTTAEVTDATPAGNVIHSADRDRGWEAAAALLDGREESGLAVLMGGGSRRFRGRPDARDLEAEFARAGYDVLRTASDLRALNRAAPPERILGLFHPRHMSVAFDRVGASRYSDELALPSNAGLGDQPSLPEMVRTALASLSAHSPAGFYLMVEAASIDKRAHDVDAERVIWDVIEFDHAVEAALDFTRAANRDADPDNDTLLIVTADHECGGLAIIGVGNERYAPARLKQATRDYAAVFRFKPEQVLPFTPNYEMGPDGYPLDPDPSRKLLLGWAAGPDHFENWVSNRVQRKASAMRDVTDEAGSRKIAVANPARDGEAPGSDNQTVGGMAIPGFLVTGTIENGEHGCPSPDECPADTAAAPHTIAGHTATDVPVSATGPGALQFTGVYENTDIFAKILRSVGGSWPSAVDALEGHAP